MYVYVLNRVHVIPYILAPTSIFPHTTPVALTMNKMVLSVHTDTTSSVTITQGHCCFVQLT